MSLSSNSARRKLEAESYFSHLLGTPSELVEQLERRGTMMLLK